MIFINLMLVMISFTQVFKVFNIILLHLEQNLKTVKTGFEFRRSFRFGPSDYSFTLKFLLMLSVDFKLIATTVYYCTTL